MVVAMTDAATTGKCAGCGHAKSSHKASVGGVCQIGVHELYRKKRCVCLGYAPVIDIAAHNTADGKPPIELYKFQVDYLRGLPAKYIFAADTGCFAKGTRVLMADMSYKNIEDVVAGDLVKTSEYTDAPVESLQRIDGCPKPMISFTYDTRNSRTIVATYDHPFYDGNRYYPLYQFIWRDLETSQRLQLQLLCQQYGQVIDHAPSRGITSSDTETWERFQWLSKDGVKWQDGQTAPSNSSNFLAQPQQSASSKPHRQRQAEQQSGKSGVVYGQAQRPTRLQPRNAKSVVSGSDISQDEIQRPDNTGDLGVVGREDRPYAENRLAYPTKAIHRIGKSLSRNTLIGAKNYFTEAVKVSNIEILEAESYYAITMSGTVKTYIVETLPVHNTGKTFMAIAHYDHHAYLKPLLILAPASKVNTGDWERELKEYFAGRLLPEYEVYSYEKFSRMPTAAQYAKSGKLSIWHDYLNRHKTQDFAVIVDEIHKAKNPQSGIGKRVFEVGTVASFFCGLSATPLPNGWVDAINYFKIFGLIKNKTEFMKRYVDIVTYKGFPEIKGYRREDELQAHWNKIAKPLDKSAALDLPPVVAVPITLKAGSDYLRIQRDRMVGDMFLDNPSALMHALRQSLVEPKVVWLDNFLEGASDNVVVFYNYKVERDQILAMLKKSHKRRTVFRQDGEKHEIPSKDKWSGLVRTITLAQYQSGSTGVEITYCSTTVYFSPTYSYSNYEQSVGRTNRNGQTKKMTLYMLCAPTTLERDVWTALRNKSDFQDTQWADKNMLQNGGETTTLGVNDVY